MSKLTIAVLFGGISTEHEVSIISAVQVLNALDKNKYDVLPIYITKEGQWIRGDQSFFDVKTFVNFEKAVKNKKFAFISPDTKFDYLVEAPSSYAFLRPLTKEHIDLVFPVFHGRFGEDGSIQGLFEMANFPYVGCGVTASAIGMDKMISKRIAQAIHVPVLDGNWVNE